MYVVPPVLATLIEPTGAQAGLAVALGERLAEPEREPLFEGEAAPADRQAAREALRLAQAQRAGMWAQADPVCPAEYRRAVRDAQ